MDPMFISRFWPDPTVPRERWLLLTCIGLLAAYSTAFLYLSLTSIRVDDVFFSKREQFALKHQSRHPLVPNQVVDVAEHGRGTPMIALLRGWSDVENWGVWTDGPRAKLIVALPGVRSGTFALQLWVNVMPAPNGKQAFGIDMNGRHLGRWNTYNGEAVLCTPIPSDIVTMSGLLSITIDIDSSRAPPDGSDDRHLGMGLKQVELLSSPADCKAGSLLRAD